MCSYKNGCRLKNGRELRLIEVAMVNGKIFVSFLQPFSDRRYYDALIDELQENGIEYVECGTTHVCTADIKA